MKLDEVGMLIAECRALFPAMTLVPGIADAWHGMLGDLGYQECRNAIHKHARVQAHIPSLAEVRRLVLSARADLPPAAVESIDAARALKSGETEFGGLPIPGRPAWAQERYEEARDLQRAINAMRKADGRPPTFDSPTKADLQQLADQQKGGAA